MVVERELASHQDCPISFEWKMSYFVVLSNVEDIFIRAVAALATPDITIHSET